MQKFKSVIVVILWVLFVTNSSYATYKEKKWGQIEDKFLEMSSFEDDSLAQAVYLYDEAAYKMKVSSDGISMRIEYHFQIKILNEDGLKLADRSIRTWHKDKIHNIKAMTFLPDGKKVKLKKKNIFKEEDGKFKITNFTLPNVQVGAVIEVKYEIYTEYIHDLDPWFFQSDIPILESTLIVELGPYLTYYVKLYNDYAERIVKTEEQYYNMDYNAMMKRFIYQTKNLPAIREEPYMTTLKNHMARIDFQIKEYSSPVYRYKYIEDRKTMCNKLIENDYKKFMKPTKQIKSLTQSLVLDDMSRDVKIKTLYEYAKDQFEDELFSYGIHPTQEPDKILKNKRASNSDRNLILFSMLRAAGIDACPAIISTRGHGKSYPEVPFLRQYNRTIVAIQDGRKDLLIDASNRFVPYPFLPSAALNKYALMIQKDNPIFLSIPNTKFLSDEYVEYTLSLNEMNEIQGDVKVFSKGYASQKRQRQLDEADTIEEFFVEEFGNQIEDFEVLQFDSLLKPVVSDTFTTTFCFKSSDIVEEIDDEIYVKPFLFLKDKKNPFVTEKREFPVEFGYKRKVRELSVVEVPNDCELIEIPKSLKIENPHFSYRRVITKDLYDAKKLRCIRNLLIKSVEVSPQNYPTFRADYAKVVDADQVQIIIKRSQ